MVTNVGQLEDFEPLGHESAPPLGPAGEITRRKPWDGPGRRTNHPPFGFSCFPDAQTLIADEVLRVLN